ncbi:hypothetical protein, partial [Corynebacterium belfantii]|uniref:hypothetical protein n=1 Tax=Corynebacterium belfantii TaxID=2014537 RepID=UPI001A7E930D
VVAAKTSVNPTMELAESTLQAAIDAEGLPPDGSLVIHSDRGVRECPIVCVRGAWFTSSPRIGRGKPRLVG